MTDTKWGNVSGRALDKPTVMYYDYIIMQTAIYPSRTQISLSPDLKRLIGARGDRLNESLSKYLRKAAVIRMALEDMETNDLKMIAKSVVDSVQRKDSGWQNIKDISAWQQQERRDEDRHRP